MASYSKAGDVAAVALDAVTPVKLFTTPTSGRHGYRFVNITGATVYLVELPLATSGPSFADMTTAGKLSGIVPNNAQWESGARESTHVWACVASGTGTVYVQELF